MRGRGRNRRRGMAAAVLVCAAAAHAAGPPVPAAAAPGEYSPAALYNQGNAYARAGNTAMAVLYYERARVISPHDPDVRANLHHVRAAAGLPEEGPWLESHARFADPDVLYWLGLIGLALAAAGLLAVRFHPRRTLGRAALVAGVSLLSMAALDAAATWPLMHEAVVVHAATARVSPAGASAALFTVPAGQVVEISDDYGEFALVRTPSGQAGWVARSDLSSVI